jgi:serine/threonine-protein kinase
VPKLGDSVDRYVIEAVIGEGGMGRVYRALDPRLGRRVALKVLLAEGTDKVRADAAARMMREARAAAAFNHPNVVAIHDVGEVDGSPYITMELVNGQTLRALLREPASSDAKKLSWLLDVARGLAAAHRAGLVHRDIKPDNVMVTSDGVVKILDFGIARRADSESPDVDIDAPTAAAHLPSLTAEGHMVGTPQYMAPEQLRGEPLDGRCDQFAWGVMAWELFTGRSPWAAAAAASIVFE